MSLLSGVNSIVGLLVLPKESCCTNSPVLISSIWGGNEFGFFKEIGSISLVLNLSAINWLTISKEGLLVLNLLLNNNVQFNSKIINHK